MRVAVIGGGKVGSYLAEHLSAAGHTVAVAEVDREKARALGEDSAALVFAGDGTDVAVLESMDIDRTDLVLAVTGHDEDNLVACQLAKTLGAKRVLARVNDPSNGPSFEALEVPAIAVTSLIVALITQEVDVQQQVRLALLGDGEVSLMELEIPAGMPARPVPELRLPRPAVLVTIVRDGVVLVPSAVTSVQAGDQVLAVTPVENEAAVREALCEIPGDEAD
jgi:trk system potassium uptake protein TrkA